MELLMGRLDSAKIGCLHEDVGIMSDDSTRIILVTIARGIFLSSLAIFALISFVAFNLCRGTNSDLSSVNLSLLAICYTITCGYGFGFYLIRNMSVFNAASKYLQPILDTCAAVFTLYLTDGLHNWLWVVFLFITLEVAFLFNSTSSVICICCAESILYGLLLKFGCKPAVDIFSIKHVQDQYSIEVYYKFLSWFWVTASNVMTGFIAAKAFIALGKREFSLKQLASTDALTGLYNQGYLLDAIKSELHRSFRYNHSFAFLLIDLDNFKKFNDTYGHQEGNRLLRCVGEILNTNIRRSGEHPKYDIDIACRFGGEEFAIILPEVQQVDEALIVAERIRSKIEQLDLDGKKTSASIGLSMFPIDGKSTTDIINAADKALYEAKRRGKNCVAIAAHADHLRPSLHVVRKVSSAM